MNKELVNRLIIESGLDSDMFPVDQGWENPELIKLIMLVLEECIELTLNYKNDQYYQGWLDYRDEIRKHFLLVKDT
jgi:hypothetical protein